MSLKSRGKYYISVGLPLIFVPFIINMIIAIFFKYTINNTKLSMVLIFYILLSLLALSGFVVFVYGCVYADNRNELNKGEVAGAVIGSLFVLYCTLFLPPILASSYF